MQGADESEARKTSTGGANSRQRIDVSAESADGDVPVEVDADFAVDVCGSFGTESDIASRLNADGKGKIGRTIGGKDDIVVGGVAGGRGVLGEGKDSLREDRWHV